MRCGPLLIKYQGTGRHPQRQRRAGPARGPIIARRRTRLGTRRSLTSKSIGPRNNPKGSPKMTIQTIRVCCVMCVLCVCGCDCGGLVLWLVGVIGWQVRHGGVTGSGASTMGFSALCLLPGNIPTGCASTASRRPSYLHDQIYELAFKNASGIIW